MVQTVTAAESEVAAPPEDSTRPRRVRRTHSALRLFRRPGFTLATVFVVFVIVTAFVPSLFTSTDPYATEPALRLREPSATHLFGTDDVGRDLWARTLYGSELTVRAALIAIGIALCAGLVFGVISGFFGGRVDAVVMRSIDVQLAIPGLLLALAIVTALGFGTVPVAIAVGIATVPGFARTTRAEVLRVKTLPYVEAARAGGAGWPRVLIRHILPNSWGPVSGLAVLEFGTAIISVAALSFLGFGAAPPRAEWGSLIAGGRNYLLTAPWVSLLPGAMVVVTVLSLNHIAKTLQQVRR
ncbi:ABC transporter permease [Nocardia macrotermitis]|uniref:Putative D,D-dipeptide transport system permease protein DdpC n=1 Tax=Nocardia macrotermitis TaxID=2585198 RepID=A0A7K0DAI7_9NOCA|nr:ABC transporter permease [Nocardia macrotermitis]MQY22790.1 putative D,D-dipeptide transport system permease protein DdpC [Nocardia macrotermitis]